MNNKETVRQSDKEAILKAALDKAVEEIYKVPLKKHDAAWWKQLEFKETKGQGSEDDE